MINQKDLRQLLNLSLFFFPETEVRMLLLSHTSSSASRKFHIWKSTSWAFSLNRHSCVHPSEKRGEREMNYGSVLRGISFSSAIHLELAFSNQYGALLQVTYPACTGALQYDTLSVPFAIIPEWAKAFIHRSQTDKSKYII